MWGRVPEESDMFGAATGFQASCSPAVRAQGHPAETGLDLSRLRTKRQMLLSARMSMTAGGLRP
jgi:hypothetical protein